MDAKSLLRAKKAEARITHPYAAYNSAGVLRCSICAVPVKQWDAHLLTKQHRTSVAREKAEQQKLAAAAEAKSKAKSNPKRPLPNDPSSSIGESSKRHKVIQNTEQEEEEDGGSGVGGLPAGFFSSGNRPKSPSPEPEDEAGPSSIPQPTGDTELDDFLSSLNDDTPQAPQPPTVVGISNQAQNTNGRRKTYKEVIPSQSSYEAAPVKIVQSDQNDEAQQKQEEEPEESEQERKERLEREEREEIVSRLEEEERAQEDADSRVASLKARMEMLKKRRVAKLGKTKSAGTTNTNGA